MKKESHDSSWQKDMDMSIGLPCAICAETLQVIHTDTHSVIVCRTCGAPYLESSIDDLPKLLIRSEWIEPTRRYWAACHRNVAPGYGCGPGSIRAQAAVVERESLVAWFRQNAKELPKDYREWARDVDGRFVSF